ncbi:MAG: hypothetical protein JSV09_04175 [Thermoplasmata archaeon]|nr:MAG: hypothetical protein JSV09_04175 [Thermoplasmata archaeon]
MRSRSKIPVLIALWMAFGSIVFWMPDHAQASESSEVTLDIQPVPPEVDVSPRSSDDVKYDRTIVKFDGSVKCIKYGPEPVKVFLFAKSTTGSASVIHPRLIFSGTGGSEESKVYVITTRVPVGTAFNITPQVTVSGYFMQRGLHYGIPSISQIIEIKPFYDLEVCSPPPQEISEEWTARFPVRITNTGNTEDTYRVEFMNLLNLMNEQWSVKTISDPSIQAGETKTIVAEAQVPKTMEPENNKVVMFNLRVTSKSSEETAVMVRQDIPLCAYFPDKGLNFPGFSVMLALIGLGLVFVILGKKGMSRGKTPNSPLGQSKDLYGKLIMSKR